MTAVSLTTSATRPSRPAWRGWAWVTWRQHRLGLLGVFALFGVIGAYLVWSGLDMHHDFSQLGLGTCGALDGPTCVTQLAAFQQDYGPLADHLPHFLMILPALVGVFLGAPLLARELESGTFRFAWTQGRSRTQWIVVKLSALGLLLTALSLAFSALFTWWYGPFDAISGRMTAYGAYEISGLVFAARTLFTFTLGALLGFLIRRTVTAMAATAIAWVGVTAISLSYLRPAIRQPITIIGSQPKGQSVARGALMNANVLSHWFEDASGQHVSYDQLVGQAIAANGGTPPTQSGLNTFLAQNHITQWLSYWPNSWFWHFQTVEALGYTIMALILAGVTALLVRRRVL